MGIGISEDPSQQYSDPAMLATELRAKGKREGILAEQNDGYDLQAKALFGLDEAKKGALYVPELKIVKPLQLPLDLALRLNRAKELYDAGVAPLIVISGGGPSEDKNAAELMKMHLLYSGVPEEVIISAGSSSDPISNLALVQAALSQNGIGDSPLMVTSSYHYTALQNLGREIFGASVEVIAAPISEKSVEFIDVLSHRENRKVEALKDAAFSLSA